MSTEEKLQKVLTDPTYEGGVQWWINKHDQRLLAQVKLTRENYAAREALALAHAILAKIPPRDVAHAAKRAAIKHEGNDPMAYIAGVLANTKVCGAGGQS